MVTHSSNLSIQVLLRQEDCEFEPAWDRLDYMTVVSSSQLDEDPGSQEGSGDRKKLRAGPREGLGLPLGSTRQINGHDFSFLS